MVSLHTVSTAAIRMSNILLIVLLVMVTLSRLTLLLVTEVVVRQITDHVLVVFLLARLPVVLL